MQDVYGSSKECYHATGGEHHARQIPTSTRTRCSCAKTIHGRGSARLVARRIRSERVRYASHICAIFVSHTSRVSLVYVSHMCYIRLTYVSCKSCMFLLHRRIRCVRALQPHPPRQRCRPAREASLHPLLMLLPLDVPDS